jgi:hypothetical protein
MTYIEAFVMFEEAYKFFKLIACLDLGVRDVIVVRSELRDYIDYIIQSELAHIIIVTHSILYYFQLDLQHR